MNKLVESFVARYLEATNFKNASATKQLNGNMCIYYIEAVVDTDKYYSEMERFGIKSPIPIVEAFEIQAGSHFMSVLVLEKELGSEQRVQLEKTYFSELQLLGTVSDLGIPHIYFGDGINLNDLLICFLDDEERQKCFYHLENKLKSEKEYSPNDEISESSKEEAKKVHEALVKKIHSGFTILPSTVIYTQDGCISCEVFNFSQ